MRPAIKVTLADVERATQIAIGTMRAFLESEGVPQDENGFFRTRLSGDEDAEVIARYREIYQPIEKASEDLGLLLTSAPIADGVLDSNRTWRTKQYDVTCCTGAEPDAIIAKVYRESIS